MFERVRVKNLIFAFQKPVLSTLPDPGESAIVPLNWELLTAPLGPYLVLNPCRWLSPDTAARVQKDLNQSFRLFNEEYPNPSNQCYSYLWNIYLSPVLYWKEIMFKAIRELEPNRVWIPAVASSSLWSNRSPEIARNEFLQWARVKILRDLEKEHEISLYGVTAASPKSTLTTNKRFKVLEACLMALKAALVARRKNRKLSIPRETLRESVLIVSQEAKSRKLRELLSQASISFDYWDYAKFYGEGLVNTIRLSEERDIPNEFSVQQFLASWFVATISTVTNSCLPRLLKITKNVKVLLFDNAHEPLSRLLVQNIIKSGRFAAYLPEGAQYPTPESWPYVENMWGHQNGEVKFALSQGEVAFWETIKHNFGEIIETGYLGNTTYVNGAQLLAAESIYRITRSQERIFLDCMVLVPDPDLGRPGPSCFEWLPEMRGLVETLNANNCVPVTNAYSADHADLLEQAFSGASIYITRSVPWQALAIRGDVLISPNSSIILEALSLERSVIVYEPPWFRAYGTHYATKYRNHQSSVLKFVKGPEELIEAVRKPGPKRAADSLTYEYFLSDRKTNAVEWVRRRIDSSVKS